MTDSSASDGTRRKWFVRIAFVVMACVAALAVALLLGLPWAANVALRRVAQRLGWSDFEADVRVLTPSCLVVGPVTAGEGEYALSIDQLVASYTVPDLRQGVIDGLVVNRLAVHVYRDASGAWRVGGLPVLSSTATEDEARFEPPVRVSRTRLCGGTVTVHLSPEQALTVAVDGDLQWRSNRELVFDLSGRISGDMLHVFGTMDPLEGNGSLRIKSPGLSFAAWREHVAQAFELSESLPTVEGRARCQMDVELASWVAQSFTVALDGARWSCTGALPTRESSSNRDTALAASAGIEVLTPEIRVEGRLDPARSSLEYVLVQTASWQDTSALWMTSAGIFRGLTGRADLNARARIGKGGLVPGEASVTLWDVTLEGPDALLSSRDVSATWQAGAAGEDWQGKASARLEQARYREWELGNTVVDSTVVPELVQVTVEPVDLSRGEDVSATARLSATCSWGEDGVHLGGQGHVSRLVLEQTHHLSAFALSLEGTSRQITLGASPLHLERLPGLAVHDLNVGVANPLDDPVAKLTGSVRANAAAMQALPWGVGADGESWEARFEGTVSPADKTSPLRLRMQSSPHPVTYDHGMTHLTGQLGLELECRGSVDRVVLSGAATASDLRLEVAEQDVSLELPAAGISLKRLQVSPVAIFRTTSAAGLLAQLQGSGQVSTEKGRLSWGTILSAQGVQVFLPFSWDGTQLSVPEAYEASRGTMKATVVTVGPATLEEPALELGFDQRALTFDGTLATSDGSTELSLSGALGQLGDVAARVTFEAHVPALEKAEWISRLDRAVDTVAVRSLAGQLALAGEASYSLAAKRLETDLSVSLTEASASLEQPKLTVTGVDLSLAFAEAHRLVSKPHQVLHFDSLSIGAMPFGSGRVAFQLEGTAGLFVEQASVAWCGGTLSAYALKLRPDLDEFEMVLYADSIELSELFNLQNTVTGSAEGTLYGKIPVSFADGRFSYQSGFLYATPGAQGTLKVNNAEVLTKNFPQDDPRLEKAEAALKHLEYDTLRLDVEGEGDLTRITIQINGKSAVDSSLPPVKLNTTIEGDINQLINVGRELHQLNLIQQ